MFNEGRYWERTQSGGDLTARVRRATHPTRPEAKQPYCTSTQMVSYFDVDNVEVARVHQYLVADGSIGGKGRPDPKRMFVNGVIYAVG
jgi:hypothetical protein